MFVNIFKYKDWCYHFVLRQQLKKSASVLDLGCGAYSPLSNIPKTFYSVGVDIFDASIKASKKQQIHDAYKKCNLLNIDKYFKSKSFDTVVILDVVEHFTKKDALCLLAKAEEVAKKKVIVLTPNGFYKQEPYARNPYQVHKSGWSKRDLQRLGYRVYGLRGLKYLRGEYATIYKKPWIVWAALSFISEPFLYFYPDLSYDLFAVKTLKS